MTESVGDRRPVTLKHVIVRDYLRDFINQRPAGSPAPSERDLVNQFGVARMTVRQAIEALVAEGLLVRQPGKGTFVAEPHARVGELRGFTEEMKARGLEPSTRTLLARREKVGPGVARAGHHRGRRGPALAAPAVRGRRTDGDREHLALRGVDARFPGGRTA